MHPKRVTSGVSAAGVPFFLAPSGGREELSESGYREAARRWNLVSELRDEMDSALGNARIAGRRPKAKELVSLIDDWYQRLWREIE